MSIQLQCAWMRCARAPDQGLPSLGTLLKECFSFVAARCYASGLRIAHWRHPRMITGTGGSQQLPTRARHDHVPFSWVYFLCRGFGGALRPQWGARGAKPARIPDQHRASAVGSARGKARSQIENAQLRQLSGAQSSALFAHSIQSDYTDRQRVCSWPKRRRF